MGLIALGQGRWILIGVTCQAKIVDGAVDPGSMADLWQHLPAIRQNGEFARHFIAKNVEKVPTPNQNRRGQAGCAPRRYQSKPSWKPLLGLPTI